MVTISSLPANVGFLDQNYNHKSVAIQIPRDAGMALIPYTCQKFLLYWGSSSMLSKVYALNHMNSGLEHSNILLYASTSYIDGKLFQYANEYGKFRIIINDHIYGNSSTVKSFTCNTKSI